jgi:hypothetical protein
MNELDRIYEEIERLLEAKDVLYNATENSEINKDLIDKLENNFNCKFDYIGKNGQVVFKDNNTNESRPLKKDDRGYIIAQKYNTNKGQQHIPEKDENATSSFMNNVLGQTSPTTPEPAPAEEKSLTLSNGTSLAAKEQSGVPAVNDAYQTEYEVVNNSEESSEKGISALNSVPSNSWEDGTWKNLCNKEKDGYYYLNDDAGARILADSQDFKPSEAQQINKKNSQWYSLYKYNNGQWQKTEPTLVNNGNKSILNPDDIVEQEEIPDAAAEVLNTNTQLNYRLKAVIDSPDIQKQIDDSPNGINYVGLNGDKISLITVTEKFSIPKELNIPGFLSRIIESKEAEISSIGAGGQTNLNVFLTPEIQKYLQSKGNPTITKVMLGKDGLVWLMDDKNNPILLDDMGVNNDVATKGQEGNSVNVFINNGGAGNNGNGENGQSSENQASEVQGNNGPEGREIGHSVTMTDLNALAGPINSKLSNLKKSLSESVSKSLGNYKCEFTELKLGKVLEGTYLNESKIHEASDNPKKEEKEEKGTAVPKKETSGDCEVYVMGEFNIRSNELTESTEKELDKILNEALETIRFKESDDITEEKSDNTDVEGSDTESSESSEVSENKNEDDQNTTEEPEENKDDDSKIEETVTNILTLSEKSIIDALNKAGNGITSLSNKTKDEGTFTGNSKQITSFSYAPGQESRTGFEATGENNGVYSFKSWFTIIIKKGNSKDSFGTGLNKFGQMLTGIGDMSAKLGMNGKSGLNSVTL